jgi:hypothetical protein
MSNEGTALMEDRPNFEIVDGAVVHPHGSYATKNTLKAVVTPDMSGWRPVQQLVPSSTDKDIPS